MMLSDPVGFSLLLAGVGLVAGAIASVSGFGIGSLLTPVLAVRVGTPPGRPRRQGDRGA